MQEGSLFSTFFPAFIISRFFDDGCSGCCEVAPHCSFDLHFSMSNVVSSCLLDTCISSLEKCLFRYSADFFFLLSCLFF